MGSRSRISSAARISHGPAGCRRRTRFAGTWSACGRIRRADASSRPMIRVRRIGSRCMSTYVLIPGAGGDGWQWHLLVRELESRGQEAIAVDLPSGDERAGWSEYADAVVASIGAPRERALILVAQ